MRLILLLVKHYLLLCLFLNQFLLFTFVSLHSFMLYDQFLLLFISAINDWNEPFLTDLLELELSKVYPLIWDISWFYRRHDFDVYHLYSYSYRSRTYTVSISEAAPGRGLGPPVERHRRFGRKNVLSARLTLSTISYQCDVAIILFWQYIKYFGRRFFVHRHIILTRFFLLSITVTATSASASI